ncbi:DNA/RNA-binding protein alba-like protein [Paraphysoderma sedebokerense]|nr:DNA/RNA-binding protein alba-like protein [Paraphysoderma sedebokerense]
MEKYRRNPKSEESEESFTSMPADIKVNANGKIRNYVSAAIRLLQEKSYNQITIIGIGKSINKTVSVAEIVKRRMNGSLHQYTEIGSRDERDVWDPVEENLDR